MIFIYQLFKNYDDLPKQLQKLQIKAQNRWWSAIDKKQAKITLEDIFIASQGLCVIQINKEFMASQNQCVIAILKLVLPETLSIKKLTLSVNAAQEEIFIQNHKIVKNNKINFYRQSIFLTAVPQQLSFKIYQIDDPSNNTLIKQLKILTSELKEIKLSPTTFKTIDQDFQLDWESWIFTENTQDVNDYTQRDYSQLDSSFENEEQPFGSKILKDQSLNEQSPPKDFQYIKKGTGSTCEPSSQNQNKKYVLAGSDFSKQVQILKNKVESLYKVMFLGNKLKCFNIFFPNTNPNQTNNNLV